MDENNIYKELTTQYGAVTGHNAAEGNTSGVTADLPAINYTVAPQREQAIRDMYNANLNAQKVAIQESGAQALSDAQANRDKIADIYNAQKNASSVDWERQRRNFLEGANVSGINTGAGSQAELSMMGQQQNAQAKLGASQAQAEVEADRNIADISRQTQASINEAIAKNDYQTAAAMLDEYKNEYNRQMDRASALAQYGDFSGYAAIYGVTEAQKMFESWAAQNPQLAYTMGAITQEQYNNLITGQPINATGNALGGFGGGGFNMADNLRAELGSMNNRIQNSTDVSDEDKARAEASYWRQMSEANRF